MSERTHVVHTGSGDYEGLVQDGVVAFKGIPYARPPFGSRRFRAPEPVARPDGVRRCFDFGPTVPQPSYQPPLSTLLPEPGPQGEDCLNLNVWTPQAALSRDGGAGLPVLVWIHGGAFQHGSGELPGYDGCRFARDGVICVTINYRLGVEGFLLLDGGPANRGLLDQVAALAWVRDQISGFGGDPGRITVAGESAGAMSISTLLAMPSAEGLFQQAITQSGAAAHVHSAAIARRVTSVLAGRLGIEPAAQEFAALDRAALIEAQDQLGYDVARSRDVPAWGELALNTMPFEPAVDGEVLPAHPLERIRAGAGASVRLLTGTNREETTLFLAGTGLIATADETILAAVAAGYGLDADAVALYRQARSGAAEPTYLYEFDWRTPQWDGALGATHALEIGFVFDNLDTPSGAPLLGPNPPQPLADEMHAAWVAFIATGDPGWPAYRDGRGVQTFGVKSRLVTDPRAQTRAVWAGHR